MTIPFTGVGGIFTQLGKILKFDYLLSQFESSLPAVFTQLQAQFATTTPAPIAPTVIAAPTVIQADQLTRQASNLMLFAGFPDSPGLGQSAIISAVQIDQPSQSASLTVALQEVIRQMKANSVTVQANTITCTPTALSGNLGTGVILVSTKRGDGLVNENTIAEILRTVCTVDSYVGGATPGQETFGIAGAPVTGGVWDYDYPTGSGTQSTFQVASADQSSDENTNLLTNSNFETWTTGPPPVLENWTLEVGTWGTDVEQNTTHQFRGTYCVQFEPTGVGVSLYQTFGNATTGTGVTPAAEFSYAVNVWLRQLAGTVSNGNLTIALVDGNDTVTQDSQGNNNTFTIALTLISTTYTAHNTIFRLNNAPPSTLRLRVYLSTGLAGDSVLMDDLCFTPMNPMYSGGPSVAVFTGSTYFAGGDGWSIANTNDYGGASFCATFQSGFDRLFDMRSLGLLLPSLASGASISNSLITS